MANTQKDRFAFHFSNGWNLTIWRSGDRTVGTTDFPDGQNRLLAIAKCDDDVWWKIQEIQSLPAAKDFGKFSPDYIALLGRLATHRFSEEDRRYLGQSYEQLMAAAALGFREALG